MLTKDNPYFLVIIVSKCTYSLRVIKPRRNRTFACAIADLYPSNA